MQSARGDGIRGTRVCWRRGEPAEKFVGGLVPGHQLLQCLGGEVAVALRRVEGAGGAEVAKGNRAGQRAWRIQ